MIAFPFRTRFESVLKAQHLDDVASIFAESDYFDEVPLYSRYQQIDFLKHYGEVDQLLIELALDYLDRVSTEICIPGTQRFIAITVIRDSHDEYLVPAIFVCNGNVAARLKDLRLSSPADGLGKRVQALVKLANREIAYSVFEDRHTVPGEVRVFIGYKSSKRDIVSLKTLANKVASQH